MARGKSCVAGCEETSSGHFYPVTIPDHGQSVLSGSSALAKACTRAYIIYPSKERHRNILLDTTSVYLCSLAIVRLYSFARSCGRLLVRPLSAAVLSWDLPDTNRDWSIHYFSWLELEHTAKRIISFFCAHVLCRILDFQWFLSARIWLTDLTCARNLKLKYVNVLVFYATHCQWQFYI